MDIEIKKDVYDEISNLLKEARKNIVSNINTTMTKTYFLIGKRIVEEEQNGNERATYGKNLIKNLSKKLTNEFEKGQVIEKPEDVVKDPYILEFLGLEEQSNYSENKLETEIINNLEKFLLELGKGFTFVGRQVRFTFDEEHFRVDLVFYNRILKCFVLIDLKIGEVTHQDLGQMQMYVNYYDRYVRLPDENKSIGIIICREKNDTLVKLTLPEDNNQIFASKYKTVLPTKEEFKKILDKNLDN